jgi:hypothetical protein
MSPSVRFPLLRFRASLPLLSTHTATHCTCKCTCHRYTTQSASNSNGSANVHNSTTTDTTTSTTKLKIQKSSYNWTRFIPSPLKRMTGTGRKKNEHGQPDQHDEMHDQNNSVDDDSNTSSIEIDSSGLYKRHHTHLSDADRQQYKEAATPLTDELRHRIRVRGPMSIAEYMNECLTHPLHGYYSTKENILPSPSSSPSSSSSSSVRGDFITSPEISQVYGELLCIWYIAVWMQLGQPGRIQFIELGPVSIYATLHYIGDQHELLMICAFAV